MTIKRLTPPQIAAYESDLRALTEAELKQELHSLNQQRLAADIALKRLQAGVNLPDDAPDLDMTNPEELTAYFRAAREERQNTAGLQTAIVHIRNITARTNSVNSELREKHSRRIRAELDAHLAENLELLQQAADVVQEHIAIAGQANLYSFLEESLLHKLQRAIAAAS
jgi:hypothetical protein